MYSGKAITSDWQILLCSNVFMLTMLSITVDTILIYHDLRSQNVSNSNSIHCYLPTSNNRGFQYSKCGKTKYLVQNVSYVSMQMTLFVLLVHPSAPTPPPPNP